MLVDGHDVRDLTLLSLRSAVGMVLDEPFLFSVSIRDNIAYGRPDASVDDVEAAARAAQAHDFITDLPDGYDTVVGERGYTLSGGQRQRIAIARTCWPTRGSWSSTTPPARSTCRSRRRSTTRSSGSLADRTTLIIAHRLSTISLADRVVLLEGGRVVASGTHAELLATEPRYADIVSHLEERRVDGLGRPGRGRPGRGQRRRSERRRRPAVRRHARRAGRPGRGILDAEPEHAEPEVHFTQREAGQRPLTLRSFLAPHRFGTAGRVRARRRSRPSPSSWARC